MPTPKPESKTTQTHLVLKIKDCQSYLSPLEFQELLFITSKVMDGRRKEGKESAEYLICNTDEPYAFLVKNLIDREEAKK